MSDQLGEWTNVTNVEITALEDQDDERGTYRARLWWEDKDDIRAAARELEVGPVHFVTFATGRTRPEGSGQMRWEDPRGAPVTLYRQPDRKVQLVVGDMEDAPPTHLPLDEDRAEEDRVDCWACGQEKVVEEGEGPHPHQDVCIDCWGPWWEAALEAAPDAVPCLHEDHDGHDVDRAALDHFLETWEFPVPFSCSWVPISVPDWLMWCCEIDLVADDPGRVVTFLDERERECLVAPQRVDEADRGEVFDRVREKVEAIEPDLRLIQATVKIWDTWEPSGSEARRTCLACGREKVVDRVTTEAVGADLTGYAESWHYTRPRGPKEEPQPYRRVCPPCWQDWTAAAQELAPDRVPCVAPSHDGHDVDPAAIARDLEDGHPPLPFHRFCVPVTVREWADLCDVDPDGVGLRGEEAEES